MVPSFNSSELYIFIYSQSQTIRLLPFCYVSEVNFCLEYYLIISCRINIILISYGVIFSKKNQILQYLLLLTNINMVCGHFFLRNLSWFHYTWPLSFLFLIGWFKVKRSLKHIFIHMYAFYIFLFFLCRIYLFKSCGVLLY